jgi:hypothetical protein
MKRFLRDNSLSLVFGALFLLTLFAGQATSGYRVFNADQLEHGESTVSFTEYLTTAHFGEATFENWESEFLQMGAYVVLTIWLRQRGSSESKPVEGESDVDKPSQRSWLYKNSLSIAFFVLFGLSFVAHAITGAHEFSSEQVAHGGSAVPTVDFLRHAQFWFESFQNWQSEFLSVASIVVLSVFLRQQGSPESKPVDMANAETPA